MYRRTFSLARRYYPWILVRSGVNVPAGFTSHINSFRSSSRCLDFYERFLAICYAIGFVLHVADLLDLRLVFSGMSPIWKAWIIFLIVFDPIAALGLWTRRWWGVATFLIVAISQLIAYVGFTSVFGSQPFLIMFHCITLIIFFALRLAAPSRS